MLSCGINKMEIWNITNKSIIQNLNDHSDCVNALLSVKLLNKTFLISGSADSSIKLYDNHLNNIQTLREHLGPILALNYDHQLQIITSNSTEKNVQIFSFSCKQLIAKKSAHNKSVSKICVLENGLIATGSDDTTIKVWKKNNEDSLELVTTLTEHTEKVNALILLKNTSLVSGSSDMTIKVWNQKNENSFECVATLNHDSEITSLAISGKSLLVSGHADGKIQIRNQTSFVLLQTLKRHSNSVYTMIFLNDEYLASGSFQEITIWQKINETSFNLLKILMGHSFWVNSIAVL